MMILLWGVIGLSVTVCVFCFFLLLTQAWATHGHQAKEITVSARPELRNSILRGLTQMSRWVPRSDRAFSAVREWLVQAGYRKESHVRLFYGIRALLILALPTLAFLGLASIGRFGRLTLLLTLAAALAGYLAPHWVLRMRKRARQNRILCGLPQALDLMVICLESGIALDQTLQYLSDQLATSYPEVSDELSYTLMELQTGLSRVHTFRNMAQRTDLREMDSFVTALIQTDQVGGSLSTTLRVYSEEMRTRQSQKAEEIAAQVPIKLIFPIFFFIFPAIFVVTGAPAAIRVARELFRVVHNSP